MLPDEKEVKVLLLIRKVCFSVLCCILVVNNQPFYLTFLKALQFFFQRPDGKVPCVIVHLWPENNKTTCFTIKIELKKLETVSTVVSKHFFFFFLAASFLTRLFIHFSNTAGCQ